MAELPVRVPRATILAIGTELTSGQVLNRNAAWISERLVEAGFSVSLHAVIPDDRTLIQEMLTYCAQRSELLIVTGGLGPTSDDFTREEIAVWSGRPLEYAESAWRKIEHRLLARGIEVAESNRQQCFFPHGTAVFENLEGTADGFQLSLGTTEVIVLPGPPREGQWIWDRHVKEWIAKRFLNPQPEELLSWKCLGKSESSLAEIVEESLKGADLTIGYRATVPYVEVKVWIPRGKSRADFQRAITQLETAIKPWTVSQGKEDLATLFLDHVATRVPKGESAVFIDSASGGLLTERLLACLRSRSDGLRERIEIMTQFKSDQTAGPFPERTSEMIFALLADGKIRMVGPDFRWDGLIPSPYSSPLMNDRLYKYRAEMAFKLWREQLSARP